MDKQYLMIVLIALILTLSFSFCFAQGPKAIFQQIFDSDGVSLPNTELGDVTFRVWIVTRPEYVLTHESTGSLVGMDATNTRFLVSFNAGNFPGSAGAPIDWTAGEIIHLEVYREATGHIAIAEFPISFGGHPQFRYRTDVVDNSISFGIVIYNSILQDDYVISTTASLVTDYDPDDNGVYRAVDWSSEGTYWQIEVSTSLYRVLSLSSQLRRQVVGGLPENRRYGPKYFTTYYSINSEDWIPVGNPNEEDNNYWWELPDSDEWLSMTFDLPDDCNDREKIWIRWYHLDDWFEIVNNGYAEIRNVFVVAQYEIDENPTIAVNPQPQNEATDVPIDLERFRWSYIDDINYKRPLGFKLYMNETGIFGAEDDYCWVPYVIGQESYSCSEILGNRFESLTIYSWMVVPTTIEPENRGDAIDCPVWSFTTLFAEGSGTEIDPWQIKTVKQLDYVRNFLGEEHNDKHFIQMTDIDLGVAPWNDGEGWVPIGSTFYESFQGCYEGNGYIVDGMFINRPESSYQGLFGYIAEGAIIRNLGVTSVDVTGGYYTAGLVSYCNASSVSFCYTTGIVRGNSYIGGLLGFQRSGSIDNSYSNCNVSAHGSYAGGLIGMNFLSIVSNCYSTSTVRADSNYAGGLVGDNYLSTVNNSYSKGDIIRTDGNFTSFGGFSGRNFMGKIHKSYSTGAVIFENGENPMNKGFCGNIVLGDDYEMSGNYWDMETSHQTSTGGNATGRTTSQMTYPYSSTTYIDWDFDEIWGADSYASINDGYPAFLWQKRLNPTIAGNPSPANEMINVSVNRDKLIWSYLKHPLYTNPVGFRVYCNTTGIFSNDDEYEWITYQEEVENYLSEDMLPNKLGFNTTYYWMVVPTTEETEQRSNERIRRNQTERDNKLLYERVDAEDCPIWSFTTHQEPVFDSNRKDESGEFIDPVNTIASFVEGHAPDENGVYRANDWMTGENKYWQISFSPRFHSELILLSKIRREYVTGSPPVRRYGPKFFTTYYSLDGEEWIPYGNQFHIDDDQWCELPDNQEWIEISFELPEECYRQETVWVRWLHRNDRDVIYNNGWGELKDVLVIGAYEADENPALAVNPAPQNNSFNVSLALDMLSWSYIDDENYAQPAGFKVYFNDTGEFGEEDDFSWIPYVEDEENYTCEDILPEEDLDYYSLYYWKVVPTTIEPQRESGRRRRSQAERGNAYLTERGDAVNVPVWSFRTISHFAAGSGTLEDPWQIATAQHLNSIRNYLGEEYSSKYYIQIADIDLGVNPWNEVAGWEPLGFNTDNSFQGKYNGSGFSIKNLTIDRADDNNVGLFGFTTGAVIENLGIDTGSIRGREYVGGLIGFSNSNTIVRYCYVDASVAATALFSGSVGSMVGTNNNSTVSNSYSKGNVTGQMVSGGLVGINRDGAIINRCYSISAVEGLIVGGLVGVNNATVTNSYWDVELSGQQSSSGGLPRTTDQMTYPYAENTFTDWNFTDIWAADVDADFNNGYPCLLWQKLDHPKIAVNPIPQHRSVDVSVTLEELGWSYYENVLFENPAGFRVYFSDSEEFNEEFEWVPFIEEQVEYDSSHLLPELLQFAATYYWKVVPTTVVPERNDSRFKRSEREQRNSLWTDELQNGMKDRGDAQNSPVWSFKTQLNPNPVVAVNPYPSHLQKDVSVVLDSLSWSYVIDTTHMNPIGFRVYLNTTGEFNEEEDDYLWIDYDEEEETFSSSDILPEQLEYAVYYYWKVVPTTIYPARDNGRTRRSQAARGKELLIERGDAENVPVWTFKIEQNPNPTIALNPLPTDDMMNVPVIIDSLSWSYVVDTVYVNPLGFKVYLNTTGIFDDNDDYHWVDYIEEGENYSSFDTLPEQLQYATFYYWTVVPTTILPEREGGNRNRRSQAEHLNELLSGGQRNSRWSFRGDAVDCPVWRFRTEKHPNPVIAVNPVPAADTTNVPIALNSLNWEYIVDTTYVNPVGFRIYLNTDGEFGENDYYDWVPYVDEQREYSSTALLIDEMLYGTRYFWKVIPTTQEPERSNERIKRSGSDYRNGIGNWKGNYRGDAEDCPIWSFITELNPNPVVAINPYPVDRAYGVTVALEELRWDYVVDTTHVNPLGFRVYINDSGDFNEDDDFDWIAYVDNQVEYSSSGILPNLIGSKFYYWQVVPTTIEPERRGEYHSPERRRRSDRDGRIIFAPTRGDAENCPIWSFVTVTTVPFVDTFAGVNTWIAVNGDETNRWEIGEATSYAGERSAYISDNNGLNNRYNLNEASVVHLYRDIVFPDSNLDVYLTFHWKTIGEGVAPWAYDYMKLSIVDTDVTPVAGEDLTTGQLGSTYSFQTDWIEERIVFPAEEYSGQSKRLVFTWINDHMRGIQPPAAIDNISIWQVLLDIPVVSIDVRDGNIILSWEAVEFANAYRILTCDSASPNDEDWVEAAIVDVVEYIEILGNHPSRFFKVVALIRD